MIVKRFEAFNDNYIWGIESDNNYLIVDPGDPEPIINFFQKSKKAKLAGILITHHHNDHVGGIKNLTNKNNFNFFALNKINFQGSNDNFTKISNKIPVIGPIGFDKYGVNYPVKEADNFKFGLINLTVLEIPGHTSNHIGYLCSNKPCDDDLSIFCGDTLFAAGCGKILGGTAIDLYKSISRIANLPNNTLVYCAHEYTLNNIEFASELFPNDSDIKARRLTVKNSRKLGLATVPSTIKEEKLTNPFLRCKNVTEFTEMRIAKDNWN